MTLKNTDASQITLRKQRKALYSWKATNTAAVNVGGSILSEQPTFQSNGVVIDRKLGGSTACGCNGNDASVGYTSTPTFWG